MSPPIPPKLPACAECQTTTQYAQGGAAPPAPSRMIQGSDGKTRIDTPTMSVITDPRAGQAIVLDHLTKEARVLPLQPGPPALAMPGGGLAAPGFKPPAMPAMQMQDLGKSIIGGHEVDGKRYIIQPPAPPAAPQAPGMPALPGMPAAPAMPTVADVWTSTKLGLPVLTQVTGPFGQQTCSCTMAQTAEPHPSMFQIPPGYKPVMPKL